MPKDKSRTIYAHETKFYRYDDAAENHEVEVGWRGKTSPSLLWKVFEHILALSEPDRTLKSPDAEWLMYIDNAKFIKKGLDNPEDCIRGFFYSTSDGLRTALIDINTLTKAKNQKKPGQNELRKTHFYIRMSDGLFLLDSYGGNIVTNARIEAYISHFAGTVLKGSNIIRLSFETLLSQGFIDKLNNFEVITLAHLRVKVGSADTYDKSDAMGHMQDEAKVVRASQIEINIAHPRAKKEGLLPIPLAKLLQKFMNRDGILSGTIKGKPLPGYQSTLKLKGAEEKYPDRFEVDAEGEVLTEPLFEYMAKLSTGRKLLSKL